MDRTLTSRSFLRALVYAALLVFALFLAYRFLSAVATVAFSLAAGFLLAVALSGPVEALHRHKMPRSLALALIVLGVLALLGLAGLLLLPTLSEQVSRFASTLPGALSDLRGWVEGLASRLGVPIPKGGPSPSSLGGSARQALGGAVGVFSGAASARGAR